MSSATAATKRPQNEPASGAAASICRPERPDRQAQLAFLIEWVAANGGFDHWELS